MRLDLRDDLFALHLRFVLLQLQWMHRQLPQVLTVDVVLHFQIHLLQSGITAFLFVHYQFLLRKLLD